MRTQSQIHIEVHVHPSILLTVIVSPILFTEYMPIVMLTLFRMASSKADVSTHDLPFQTSSMRVLHALAGRQTTRKSTKTATSGTHKGRPPIGRCKDVCAQRPLGRVREDTAHLSVNARHTSGRMRLRCCIHAGLQGSEDIGCDCVHMS